MFDVHKTTAAAYAIGVDGDRFWFAAANQACLDLTGVATRFVTGVAPHDMFDADVADKIVDRYETCRTTRQAVSYVSEYLHPRGTRIWRTTLFPMLDDEGVVSSLYGICIDITAETLAEREKDVLRTTLSTAIGAIKGGFWVYDVVTGSFETSRPLAEYIAGPGHASLNLAEYAGYIHAEDLSSGALLTPKPGRQTFDFRVVTFEGRTRWLQTKRSTIQDADGTVIRMIGLVIDITEQKAAMRALESEATTDSLTGLSNRRAFDRIATRLFKSAAAAKTAIGVLVLDLDGFKPINDRHGHRAGDEILRKVGKRIARLARSGDTIARLGGDEFAILVREGTPKSMAALTARIERAFSKPFPLLDGKVALGASIGTAISREGDETFLCVLDRADRALYANKDERQRLCA